MVDYDRIKAENDAYKALARIQDKNSEATYASAFVIGRDTLAHTALAKALQAIDVLTLGVGV